MRVEEQAKDLAHLVAQRSNLLFQHGAVVIKKGKIIASGRNYKNGCRMGNPNIFSVHAEVNAIESTKLRGLRGATIVIYAESKGRQKTSKPCPNCFHILQKLGFRKLVYSTHDGWKIERIN